jgi:hypothetical protein
MCWKDKPIKRLKGESNVSHNVGQVDVLDRDFSFGPVYHQF